MKKDHEGRKYQTTLFVESIYCPNGHDNVL